MPYDLHTCLDWCTPVIIVKMLLIRFVRSLTFHLASAFVLIDIVCVQHCSQQAIGVHFVEDPVSVVVKPGDRAVLTCSTNIKVDHLRWQHEWRTLEPGRDPRVTVEPGRLVVHVAQDPNIYQKQIGLYRCMAWVVPIGVTSLAARLSVASLQNATDDVSDDVSDDVNTTLVAPPGGSVLIHCALARSIPPAKVTFYRDGRAVQPHGDSVISTAPGRLLLSDLSADAHNGFYTCLSVNPVTGASALATPLRGTQLFVRRPPEGAVRAPSFTTRPLAVYRATLNQSLSLECVCDGWPVPVISWRRVDGGPWSARRYVRSAAVLHLRHLVAGDDNAQFECAARNELGAVFARTKVRLLAAPSVRLNPADITVPEGKSVSVTCDVTGEPKPRVYWLLEGRPVTSLVTSQTGSAHAEPLLVDNATRLVIGSVRRRHAALYQCFAENSQGQSSGGTLLRVIPRPHRRYSPQTTSHIHSSTSGGDISKYRRQNRHKSSLNDETLVHYDEVFYDEDYEDQDAYNAGDTAQLLTPSAPEVFQISNTAVMLSWSMQATSSSGTSRHLHGSTSTQHPITTSATDYMAVLFFKIQYRRLPTRRYRWSTLDADISATARTFRVDQLQSLAKYKFRVLAVYANKDNRNGPNSPRLKLVRMRAALRPRAAPELINATTEGASGVNLRWKYSDGGAAATSTAAMVVTNSSAQSVRPAGGEIIDGAVDGFIIHYRTTTSGGEYSLVSVSGGQRRSHKVTSLMPATVYDFKVQAYRTGGGLSDFSSIVSARTEPSPSDVLDEGSDRSEPLLPSASGPSSSSGVPSSDVLSLSASRVRLYTVVGSLFAVLVVMAGLTATTVFYCRSRTQKQGAGCMYGDCSQQVSLEPFPCSTGVEECGETMCDTVVVADEKSGSRHQIHTCSSAPGTLRNKWKFGDRTGSSACVASPLAVSIPLPPSPGAPTSRVNDIALTSPSPTLSSTSSSLTLSQATVSSVERRRRKLRRSDSIETQRNRKLGRNSLR